MAADKERYEEADKKYTEKIDAMEQGSLQDAQEFKSGEAYQKSVEEGKKVAQDLAGGAASEATSRAIGAGRAAGLTPAQAAALAGQQTASTYANTASQQQGQQQAASMGAKEFGAGQAERTRGNVAQSYGGRVGQAQQQEQAEHSRKMDWTNLGLRAAGSGLSALGGMVSDERMKNAYKIYQDGKKKKEKK